MPQTIKFVEDVLKDGSCGQVLVRHHHRTVVSACSREKTHTHAHSHSTLNPCPITSSKGISDIREKNILCWSDLCADRNMRCAHVSSGRQRTQHGLLSSDFQTSQRKTHCKSVTFNFSLQSSNTENGKRIASLDTLGCWRISLGESDEPVLVSILALYIQNLVNRADQ